MAVLSGTEERSTWRFRVWGFRVRRLGFRGIFCQLKLDLHPNNLAPKSPNRVLICMLVVMISMEKVFFPGAKTTTCAIRAGGLSLKHPLKPKR